MSDVDEHEAESGEVFGRYRIDAMIGRGGLARVYLVTHLDLGVKRALKVLMPSEDVSTTERLVHEGRVQSQLRHPNVLPALELIDVNGHPALVMDYIDGPALDDVLGHMPLSLEQVDEIARGILAGVAAAHAQGLVHRDLKPGNVLLDLREGRPVPRVADFGLVKALDLDLGATSTGQLLGTPRYMAPEQLRDPKGVDRRADVWSLGAMLYELVTGELAFGGDSLVDVLRAVDEGQFVPPEALAPDAPTRMLIAIQEALQPNPEDRCGSAGALAALWAGGVPAPAAEWDVEVLRALRPEPDVEPAPIRSWTPSMPLSRALLGDLHTQELQQLKTGFGVATVAVLAVVSALAGVGAVVFWPSIAAFFERGYDLRAIDDHDDPVNIQVSEGDGKPAPVTLELDGRILTGGLPLHVHLDDGEYAGILRVPGFPPAQVALTHQGAEPNPVDLGARHTVMVSAGRRARCHEMKVQPQGPDDDGVGFLFLVGGELIWSPSSALVPFHTGAGDQRGRSQRCEFTSDTSREVHTRIRFDEPLSDNAIVEYRPPGDMPWTRMDRHGDEWVEDLPDGTYQIRTTIGSEPVEYELRVMAGRPWTLDRAEVGGLAAGLPVSVFIDLVGETYGVEHGSVQLRVDGGPMIEALPVHLDLAPGEHRFDLQLPKTPSTTVLRTIDDDTERVELPRPVPHTRTIKVPRQKNTRAAAEFCGMGGAITAAVGTSHPREGFGDDKVCICTVASPLEQVALSAIRPMSTNCVAACRATRWTSHWNNPPGKDYAVCTFTTQ